MLWARKSISVVLLILACASVMHANSNVVRCTAGSPRWQGKARKFKLVLESSAPAGECRLSLSRESKEVFATQAKIIDLQAIDVDLNLDNQPDLAFQTGPSGGCCWTLHVLALGEVPEPVGEISNGFPFVVRRENDGWSPEFWSQDDLFADGFDGLNKSELTNLPFLVIQWDGAKPLYVASRFAIKGQSADKIELQLTKEQLAAFRQSDGRLEGSSPEIQQLRKTKTAILAIVLSDLYSSVDDPAWKKLEELWPPSDIPRIRALLAERLARGLRSRLTQLPVLINPNCPYANDQVRRVGAKVSPPSPQDMPEPEYSKEAKAANYEGTVVLWVVISGDGCVSKLRVQRPLGMGLDQKAIEAVRTWKFKPARQSGTPVSVEANIEVRFRVH